MFSFSKKRDRQGEEEEVNKAIKLERFILNEKPSTTQATIWQRENLRLIQEIKQQIRYLNLSDEEIYDFVEEYLSRNGINNYQGNGNIDTLVEVVKSGITIKDLVGMRRELDKSTGVKLSETDPNDLVKYLRENFVTQHTLPVQQINGDMLMNNIFGSAKNQKELDANKNELAECIMQKEVFSIDLLHPEIQHLLREQRNGVTIQLVEGQKFNVRAEIIGAIKRFESIGAQADSKADKYSPEAKATTPFEIPLCFLVICGAHRAIHSTIVFLIKGRLYSIGFGYWNETDEQYKHNVNKSRVGLLWASHLGQGALYSADRVFEPKLENRIAGVWLLERDIIGKIQETMSTSRNMWGTLSIVEDDGNGKELVIVEECVLDSTLTYNTIPTRPFETNCAHWAQKILDGKVTCSLYKLPKMPSQCIQISPPGMTNAKILDIINSYQSGNASELMRLLSVPASSRTGSWEGGKRKTKTKKHIKRNYKKTRRQNKNRRYRKQK